MNLKQKIRKIIEKNEWINGMVDFREGDLMALVEAEEIFNENKINFVNNPKELFENLKRFDGIFIFSNLVFINSNKFGCFVYDLRDKNYWNYFEHLTITERFPYNKLLEIIERKIAEE